MHVRRSFVKTFGLLIVAALLLAALPVGKVQAAFAVSNVDELRAALLSTETEITVTANIDAGSVSGSAFTVASGRTVTLDLNGFEISAETSNGGVFNNAGSLTISDNSGASDGKIINTNTAQTTTGEAAKSAITNTGVLIVNTGVTVEGPANGHGSWGDTNFNPAYGIDNLGGGEVIINGANISGAYGLRNFANADGTTITVNDGTIAGKTGIAMQSFGTNSGALTINGNTTIAATTGSAIYAAGVTQYNQIVINGGTFSGEDEYGTVCVVDGTLEINGGKFTGNNGEPSLINYYASVDVSAGSFYGEIYGGEPQGKTTFAPPQGEYVFVYGDIDGNVEGLDRVKAGYYVDSTGSIQAAIDAVNAGDTILVAPGTYLENLSMPYPVNLVATEKVWPNFVHVRGQLDINHTDYSGSATTLVEGIYFETLSDVTHDSIVLKNVHGITIHGCMFNGGGKFMDGGGRAIQMNGSNSNVLVEGGVIQTGYYLAIQGHTADLRVKDVTIDNVKSGINLQGGGNLIVENPEIVVVAQSAVSDSYGIRFASETGTAENMSILGDGYIEINKAGIIADTGIYHSAIVIRKAASGTLIVEDVRIDGEVVNLSTTTLDASPNWWGSAEGPSAGAIVGDVNYIPWCTNPECTEFASAVVSMSPAAGSVPNCYGETTVNVMVGAVDQLAGFDIRVNYDPTLVEIIKVENGDLLSEGGIETIKYVDIGPGEKQIQFQKVPYGSGGNWELVTSETGGSLITIKVKPLTAEPVVLTLDAASELTRTEDAWLSPYAIGQLTSTVTTTTANVLNTTKGIPYCSLQAAVTAADADDNLQVLTDFEVPAQVNIDKTLSFDTNGFTVSRPNLTGNYDGIFNVVANGDLAISGSGTLSAISGYQGAPVTVDGGVVSLADATLKGPYASIQILADSTFNMTSGTADGCIVIKGTGATANISGGLVQGTNDFAIAGNGIAGNGGTTINISGSAEVKVVGDTNVAIYHPQDGELNISGGTISGYNGIEMKAGNLKVTGGTILGNGAYVASPDPNDNGSVNTGDAIFLNGRNAYTGDISVHISGGVITSDSGWALREFVGSGQDAKMTEALVDGGKFTGGQGAVFFTTVDPSVLKLVVGGAYNTDPGASPDYVYDPFGTYGPISGYYYIEEMKTVSGVVSMQGRTTRAGVPLALMSGSPLAASYNATSTDPSGNYSFGYVAGGTYVFTTNQPRYLNVTADLNKEFTAPEDFQLPTLRLFGGNAFWRVSDGLGGWTYDNVIDESDAAIVGGAYGTGNINSDGDVNFDNRVNIQDLAMVGGNYDLTSAEAYSSWLVSVP